MAEREDGYVESGRKNSIEWSRKCMRFNPPAWNTRVRKSAEVFSWAGSLRLDQVATRCRTLYILQAKRATWIDDFLSLAMSLVHTPARVF